MTMTYPLKTIFRNTRDYEKENKYPVDNPGYRTIFNGLPKSTC